MTDALARLNNTLAAAAPELWSALSPLGRRIHFPLDIPFQAAQAKGKTFNGTIGQITDGRGNAIALSAFSEALSGLNVAERNRALLYSPVEGFTDVRQAWGRWQRRAVTTELATTLPFVTAGLGQALALLADLFGGDGRAVVVPAPYWGNYRATFGTLTGARMVPTAAYEGDGFGAASLAQALSELPVGEPAVVMLNLPSNPGGYSLTIAERAQVKKLLLAAAEDRVLVVICDDAYAGLVYEAETPAASMFWELGGQHKNLLPVKVDGITKELAFFGGRLGFITFAADPDSELAQALENKLKGLVRSGMGSPVAVTQVLAKKALDDPRSPAELESLRQELERRYRAMKRSLATVDPELLRPLPCNSGCFALVELPPGLDPERVRLHLLEHHDTGLVSVNPKYIRIAFCSVAEEAIAELVRRLEKGVGELMHP
jgi:aspartate/methionine/tyrosine aminotransferase